jgi:hypothetical protein
LNTAATIALLLFLAMLAETLVDMLKVKFGLGKLGSETVKGILWPCVAAVIGIGLAFAFQASVLALVPSSLSVSLAWPIDRLLAGVVIGAGGASLIYDFLDRGTTTA